MEFSSHSKLSASIIIILLHFSSIRVQSHPQNNHSDQYIKTSCGVTIYTKLCFDTLSPYADSIQSRPEALANAALNVSLKAAESTLSSISKLSKGKHLNLAETHVVSDCVENVKDSVSELQESVVEMKGLEGVDFEEKMGNVMTWVSAALTDEDTCLDGFEGNNDDMNGKIKSIIRIKIVNVAHLISNALALIKNISSI